MVTARSPFKLDWAYNPGKGATRSPNRAPHYDLPVLKHRRPIPHEYPIGTITFTRGSSPPFHLACFHDYASIALLPTRLQALILSLWLAVTQAGISPARTCDIAMPQL